MSAVPRLAQPPAEPSTLAARTLAIRDRVRAMWGDDYQRRIAPFRQQIRDEVALHGGPALAVPPRIAGRLRQVGQELLPLELVVLVAAAVDETEAGRG
jgi:hypothetical protein